MSISKSADALLAELSASVRRELVESLRPSVRKIAEAAAELESALNSMGGGARRGRPRGRARAAGAPPRPAAAGRPKGQKNPRGALQGVIRKVFSQSTSGLTLANLRDAVLRDALYAGRNGKALYTQIIHALKRMPEVQRTPKGQYSVKGSKKSS